jgi:hypothetical protein
VGTLGWKIFRSQGLAVFRGMGVFNPGTLRSLGQATMKEARSDDHVAVRSRFAPTARRDVGARGGDSELRLADLADNARCLPSKSWRVGVALIVLALVAALVAFALTARRSFELI